MKSNASERSLETASAAPSQAAPVGCVTSLGRASLGTLVYFLGLGAAYSTAMARHPSMSSDAQGGTAMALVLMLPVHILLLAFVGIASFSAKRWLSVFVATGAAVVVSLFWYLQCF